MARNIKILPPKSDIVFKWIFGDENDIDILTDFLKAVLSLPAEEYDEVRLADTSLKRRFGDDKLGILDVKVKTKTGKMIDVEIQVANMPNLRERVTYYNAKMLTEQIGDGEDYSGIKRTISIIIADFDIVADGVYHHCFKLYDRENCVEFNDLVEIDTLELRKLPEQAKDDKERLLVDWLKFLKSEEVEEMEVAAKNNPLIEKAKTKVLRFSEDENARMRYEALEKERRDWQNRMLGARTEGRLEGVFAVARKMISRRRPIEEIIEDTGLTRAEIENLN